MRLLGVALVVFGVVVLAYGGFSYTRREKVLEIGSFQATALREKTLPVAPFLGVAALVGGVALLLLGKPRGA